MRKPYCKMSLKDLLEQLSAVRQEQGEAEIQAGLGHAAIPIRSVSSLQPVHVDEETQSVAVLHAGRHPVGDN